MLLFQSYSFNVGLSFPQAAILQVRRSPDIVPLQSLTYLRSFTCGFKFKMNHGIYTLHIAPFIAK